MEKCESCESTEIECMIGDNWFCHICVRGMNIEQLKSNIKQIESRYRNERNLKNDLAKALEFIRKYGLQYDKEVGWIGHSDNCYSDKGLIDAALVEELASNISAEEIWNADKPKDYKPLYREEMKRVTKSRLKAIYRGGVWLDGYNFESGLSEKEIDDCREIGMLLAKYNKEVLKLLIKLSNK